MAMNFTLVLILTFFFKVLYGVELLLPNIDMLKREFPPLIGDDPLISKALTNGYQLFPIMGGSVPLGKDEVIWRYGYRYPLKLFNFNETILRIKKQFDLHVEMVSDTEDHLSHGFVDQKNIMGILVSQNKPNRGFFNIEYVTKEELLRVPELWGKQIPMSELK